MNSNIYGGITYPGTSLVFDKVYDNYKQATTNINTEEQNSGPQYDNVMLGRYVLIKYCERAFSYEEKKQIEKNPIIKINNDNNSVEFEYTIILPGTYTFSFSFLSNIGGYSVYVNKESVGGDSANTEPVTVKLQELKKGDFIYINISGDNSIPNCLEKIKNSFRFEFPDINLDNLKDYSSEEQYYYNYKQDGGYSFDRTILRKVYKGNTYQYEEIGKIESAIPLADLTAQVEDAKGSTEDLKTQLAEYTKVADAISTAVSIVGESNQINGKGYPITAIGKDNSGYYFNISVKEDIEFFNRMMETEHHLSAYVRFKNKENGEITGQRYDYKKIINVNTSNGAQEGSVYIDFHHFPSIPENLELVTYDNTAETLNDCSYVFIIEEAQKGDYPISYIGAFATGYDNKALGAGSFSAGLSNTAEGVYSAAFGKENKVAYAGSVFGRNNTINGQLGTSFGQHNTIDGHNSATFGLYNEIKNSAAEAMVGGIHNIASGKGQFVIGTANEDNSDALFIVGNGTAEDIRAEETETNKLNRSNAFEVLKDGTVIIGSSIKYANGMPIAGDLTTGIKKTPNETAMYANLWQGSGKIPEEDYELKTIQEDGKTIYLITNGNDLYKFFSEIIYNSTESVIYAEQTQNIYLNNIFLSEWWKEQSNPNYWLNISKDTDLSNVNLKAFEYDGQGYGIFGLLIPSSIDTVINYSGGLLPKAISNRGNITFKNTHLCQIKIGTNNNSDINDNNEYGGFIGTVDKDTNTTTISFKNCGIDALSSVRGDHSAGGFIGYAKNNQNLIQFENCYSKASITSKTSRIGAFIGNSYIGQSSNLNIKINNCYCNIIPFVFQDGGGSHTFTDCTNLYTCDDTIIGDTNSYNFIKEINNLSLVSMPELATTFKELYGEVLPQEQSFYGLDTIGFDKLFNNISFHEGTKYFDINNVSNITFSTATEEDPITKLGVGEDSSLQMKIYQDGDLNKEPKIQKFLTDYTHPCAANLIYNIVVSDELPTDSPTNTLVFIKSTASASEIATS